MGNPEILHKSALDIYNAKDARIPPETWARGDGSAWKLARQLAAEDAALAEAERRAQERAQEAPTPEPKGEDDGQEPEPQKVEDKARGFGWELYAVIGVAALLISAAFYHHRENAKEARAWPADVLRRSELAVRLYDLQARRAALDREIGKVAESYRKAAKEEWNALPQK